ncbi:hypothetical protein [Mitsuaria sp. BK037]|uniref:hypothetical protein n=1 Tax=Mitsuaria sp. BK037 TaxID=2587122 RepID=UPI00161240C1|nr:hypothetical protein [Mitsuaria sp. BK037]MBB3281639.1 hypothetical protein [Mitsuaria sp. BK037]
MNSIPLRRLLAFLLVVMLGMTAIVAFLHVSRSESFWLRKVHLIQSNWIEIQTTFGKGKGSRARALEVIAVDGQHALRIVDRDLERAQAFVDRHAPGAEIEVWRSPDGSQLHAPELADLAPYGLGLFIALVPVAMLSALLTLRTKPRPAIQRAAAWITRRRPCRAGSVPPR